MSVTTVTYQFRLTDIIFLSCSIRHYRVPGLHVVHAVIYPLCSNGCPQVGGDELDLKDNMDWRRRLRNVYFTNCFLWGPVLWDALFLLFCKCVPIHSDSFCLMAFNVAYVQSFCMCHRYSIPFVTGCYLNTNGNTVTIISLQCRCYRREYLGLFGSCSNSINTQITSQLLTPYNYSSDPSVHPWWRSLDCQQKPQ